MVHTISGNEIKVEALLLPIRDELHIYHDLLVRWNSKLNLIGGGQNVDIYQRHFMDSIQLSLFFNIDNVWADLGSGAGFPGLVISLLQKKNGLGFTKLFESDQRKAAFLREVSRETKAPVEVVNRRCEHSPEIAKCNTIVSRAMTSLAKLTLISAKALDAGAVCGFLKGHNYNQELTELETFPNLIIEIHPSLTREGSVIVRMRRPLLTAAI